MLDSIENDEDLIFNVNTNPRPLNGYKLQTPHIMLGKNRDALVKGGSINLKEKVLDPYFFKDLLFFYSVSKEPEYDREDADEAYSLLVKSAKTFGIQFSKEPIWVEVKGGKVLEDWKKQIDK